MLSMEYDSQHFCNISNMVKIIIFSFADIMQKDNQENASEQTQFRYK